MRRRLISPSTIRRKGSGIPSILSFASVLDDRSTSATVMISTSAISSGSGFSFILFPFSTRQAQAVQRSSYISWSLREEIQRLPSFCSMTLSSIILSFRLTVFQRITPALHHGSRHLGRLMDREVGVIEDFPRPQNGWLPGDGGGEGDGSRPFPKLEHHRLLPVRMIPGHHLAGAVGIDKVQRLVLAGLHGPDFGEE